MTKDRKMTVGEIIDRLSAFPADNEVLVEVEIEDPDSYHVPKKTYLSWRHIRGLRVEVLDTEVLGINGRHDAWD